MNDVINRPSHYCDGRKYEPIDVITDWGLNFNLGNTVKYISRAGRKDDMLQDLKKARFYLDYEIRRLEEERIKAANAVSYPTMEDISGEIKEAVRGA